MWRTKPEFLDAAAAAVPEYQAMKEEFSWLCDVNAALIDKGWNLYRNARDSNLGLMVMGRTNLGRDQPLPFNAITQAELANFRATSEMRPYSNPKDRAAFSRMGRLIEGTGSILDTRHWHFFINDCWILGGVHSHQEFHLVTPRTKEAIFPDYLTVTGRELLGLTNFGYQIVKTTLEEILVCRDNKKADDASFIQYQEIMAGPADKWKPLVDSSLGAI